MKESLEERISRIFYEFDCPKCYQTNYVRQADYQDGEVITCDNCGKRFTEYDDDYKDIKEEEETRRSFGPVF